MSERAFIQNSIAGSIARQLLAAIRRGSPRPFYCRGRHGRNRSRWAGFTLIELMIVITIILTLLSIAAPMYRTSIVRSKEAVLRDDLFTLRSLIDQYTLDKQEAPQSLEDLVANGYIREIPVDPFTASNQTWVAVYEDAMLMIPGQTMSGIVDVHSGSNLTSLTGELYSSW
ncbi:MAG: prepilin-type N-terminal cleavage/methylation domain-containing protein [Acidobacteria bacterium]|nr:prepilin-type N-terminal cleavage/methylation domain-containing protein [Acidobacteriota bacterium]